MVTSRQISHRHAQQDRRRAIRHPADKAMVEWDFDICQSATHPNIEWYLRVAKGF